jgi:hypothetical protein
MPDFSGLADWDPDNSVLPELVADSRLRRRMFTHERWQWSRICGGIAVLPCLNGRSIKLSIVAGQDAINVRRGLGELSLRLRSKNVEQELWP